MLQRECLQAWRTDALAERLQAFIAARSGDTVRVSDLKRFTAGFSWVTVRFRAVFGSGADLALIVRIGDPNGLLAPYTARPEHLLLETLHGTPRLPLPKAYWFSDDPAVVGAPFLITECVRGVTPLPVWTGDGAAKAAGDRSDLLDDFVDALVAIHGFAWREGPLAELAPAGGDGSATIGEVERWIAFAASPVDGPNALAMHFAGEWLTAHARPAAAVVLVHGDYRVGNFMALDGRISAILDWELAHVGDPHEDLAWVGMRTFGGTGTLIGGLFDRAEFYRRYEERARRVIDWEAIRYFEVLSQFKMAAILVGAERRLREGAVHDVRLGAMSLQMSRTLMGLMSMIKAAARC